MSRRAATLAAAGALLLATSRRAGAEEQDNSTVTQEDLVITDVVRLILQFYHLLVCTLLVHSTELSATAVVDVQLRRST